MPRVELDIVRAWWHDTNAARIHYVVLDHDGVERSLSCSRHDSPALWHLLHDALKAQGYEGHERRRPTETRDIEDIELPPDPST